MKKPLITLFSVLIIISLVIFTTIIVKYVSFNQQCGGYLERAANSNSIEMALEQVSIALEYIEENNFTTGYTSILWRTPDEDIKYWYDNLKTCQDELLSVTPEMSSLEKTNILMKLRESLTDNGKDGTKLIIPDGISRYPNNTMWGILLWLAGIAIVISGFGIAVVLDEN